MDSETFNPDLFYRSFDLDRAALDEEKREVPVTFSSEIRARRWFGVEILAHGKGNVDLSRLKATGSALLNHLRSFIIGPISGARIDFDERKGRAVIRFDDDEQGEYAFKKVKSGSLRGVSVGYDVTKFKELREGETLDDRFEGPAYVATRWAAVEISLTPTPLDATVGVGRCAARSLEGIEVVKAEKQVKSTGKEESREMDEIVERAKTVAVEKRNETFGKVFERAAAIGQEPKALELLAKGRSLDEITDEIVARHSSQRGKPSNVTTSCIGGEPAATIEKIDDDTFVRSICSPSIIPVGE